HCDGFPSRLRCGPSVNCGSAPCAYGREKLINPMLTLQLVVVFERPSSTRVLCGTALRQCIPRSNGFSVPQRLVAGVPPWCYGCNHTGPPESNLSCVPAENLWLLILIPSLGLSCSTLQ